MAVASAVSDFSREPSDYRPDPKGHLYRRRDERGVPWDAIGEVIRNGEQVPAGDDHPDDSVKLRGTWNGVCYYVVLWVDRGWVRTTGVCG